MAADRSIRRPAYKGGMNRAYCDAGSREARMDFDLAIRGGTLVDGTGRAGVRGDLGIKDGRLAAVGEVEGTAARTLEADGRIVAPGFIDIHTHYDAQVLWDRMLTISPWHGVTSVVMGNCGFGVAPTRPEHRGLILRTLEKRSEEHTSELQSRRDLVCRLLLEKKKKQINEIG